MSHEVIEAERLTIYCTETDRHAGQPLFEWLVQLALDRDLGGATVTKGLAGFGRHHRLHHQHLMSLMDELPVIVQMIDEAAKIDAYLDATGDALTGYTYIREKVRWHRPGG